LIFPPAPFGHLDLELDSEPIRTFFETLATSFTVVRYDRLGTGLSDRTRPSETMTLEFEVDVLEALVAELGDKRISLFGVAYGAAVAAGLAARRPDRVKRLLLYGAYADGGGVLPAPLLESMNSLLRADWDLGSRVLATAFLPEADRKLSYSFARLQAQSCRGDMAASLLELSARTDVRDMLGQVTAPTLVVHREQDPVVPVASGRDVAALVPGARFQLLEGRWHLPWFGDTSAVLRAVAEFLGFPALAPSPAVREALPEGAATALTPRERDVLSLVAEGYNDASIARALVLSAHTVHRHVANIRTRLGQPSRAAAAAHATRLGLI
jgi:pimeloyl-ACP methyl ester carboxylesterase/DNA-binding CsgD family transcriptional regulator